MTEREIMTKTSQFIDQESCTEEQFNEMALLQFRYQFKENLPYQSYCRTKGITPRLVKSWREVPAVPIDAFKNAPLSCSPIDQVEAIFMTSGTTTGNKGKHYHPTLQIYDKSMIRHFKKRFMGMDDTLPMGILFPTREQLPNSSLAHYLALAASHFSDNDYTYFVNHDGLQVESLIEELKKREEKGRPYALLGASFSFVHLFEALDELGLTFSLPYGSKILDTGGFKNQSKELEQEDFYEKLTHYLGVDRKNCINMFGMTELSTQFYDHGNEVVPSIKSGPFWIRTRVVNPLSGEEVADGEQGVLIHHDLANYNSVSAILTEDIGIKKEDGFLFIGRATGAEAKGCSLALEEFIQATKGV